jgi:hypothetical protein
MPESILYPRLRELIAAIPTGVCSASCVASMGRPADRSPAPAA